MWGLRSSSNDQGNFCNETLAPHLTILRKPPSNPVILPQPAPHGPIQSGVSRTSPSLPSVGNQRLPTTTRLQQEPPASPVRWEPAPPLPSPALGADGSLRITASPLQGRKEPPGTAASPPTDVVFPLRQEPPSPFRCSTEILFVVEPPNLKGEDLYKHLFSHGTKVVMLQEVTTRHKRSM
jgi:hypothetical protein